MSWAIKEQTVEDPVSGITFQFETRPGSDAPWRMKLYENRPGVLPYGNREVIFDRLGDEAGGGTLIGGLCKPSRLVRTGDECEEDVDLDWVINEQTYHDLICNLTFQFRSLHPNRASPYRLLIEDKAGRTRIIGFGTDGRFEALWPENDWHPPLNPKND